MIDYHNCCRLFFVNRLIDWSSNCFSAKSGEIVDKKIRQLLEQGIQYGRPNIECVFWVHTSIKKTQSLFFARRRKNSHLHFLWCQIFQSTCKLNSRIYVLINTTAGDTMWMWDLLCVRVWCAGVILPGSWHNCWMPSYMIWDQRR